MVNESKHILALFCKIAVKSMQKMTADSPGGARSVKKIAWFCVG
jgi:hypothetical protein